MFAVHYYEYPPPHLDWRVARSLSNEDFDASLTGVVLENGAGQECDVCYLSLRERDTPADVNGVVLACSQTCHASHSICHGCAVEYYKTDTRCYYCRRELMDGLNPNITITPLLAKVTDLEIRKCLTTSNFFIKTIREDKQVIQLNHVKISRAKMLPPLMALLLQLVPNVGSYETLSNDIGKAMSEVMDSFLTFYDGACRPAVTSPPNGKFHIPYVHLPIAQALLIRILNCLAMERGIEVWGEDLEEIYCNVQHYMKASGLDPEKRRFEIQELASSFPPQPVYTGAVILSPRHHPSLQNLWRYGKLTEEDLVGFSERCPDVDPIDHYEMWVASAIMLVNYFIKIGTDLYQEKFGQDFDQKFDQDADDCEEAAAFDRLPPDWRAH